MKKLIKVVFVFEEGSKIEIQWLNNEEAENWLKKVNGAVSMASLHGHHLPDFPWKTESQHDLIDKLLDLVLK